MPLLSERLQCGVHALWARLASRVGRGCKREWPSSRPSSERRRPRRSRFSTRSSGSDATGRFERVRVGFPIPSPVLFRPVPCAYIPSSDLARVDLCAAVALSVWLARAARLRRTTAVCGRGQSHAPTTCTCARCVPNGCPAQYQDPAVPCPGAPAHHCARALVRGRAMHALGLSQLSSRAWAGSHTYYVLTG